MIDIHSQSPLIYNRQIPSQHNMSEDVPLIETKTKPQPSGYDVCVLLPLRHTEHGIAPKSIYFRTDRGDHLEEVEPHYHRFDATQAIHLQRKQSRYIFHTTLNKSEISNSLIKICDDEIEAESKFHKLIPDGFDWNKRTVLYFQIGKFQDIWFRKFDEDHPIIMDPFADNVENQKIIRETLGNATDVNQWIRCKVVIFTGRCITMSSFHTFFEKDELHGLESLIYRRLDFSPFRSSLRSATHASDLFAHALENVRENFVNLLTHLRQDLQPGLGLSIAEQQHLKMRFDLKFLRISNMKTGDGMPCFILYDDVKETFYFVEIHDGKEVKWATELIYEHSSCLQTTNVDVQVAVRHNWIKYQCLHGQDDEFNIFRSLCFAPQSTVEERYHIGFVALTLQILLCIGIMMDSIENWSGTTFEDIWDLVISLDYGFEDILIVTISTFTFAFMLQRFRKTIETFKRFYININQVCSIPKVIIVLDFTSNILVGAWMCMVTPFFLLQSEDIQTVVLNSFALTIFIELDDLANIFESDEAFLLHEDAILFRRKLREAAMKNGQAKESHGVVKRDIGGNWSGHTGFQMTLMFIFSPLYEMCKIIAAFFSIFIHICCSTESKNEDAAVVEEAVETYDSSAESTDKGLDADAYAEKLSISPLSFRRMPTFQPRVTRTNSKSIRPSAFIGVVGQGSISVP